VFLLLLFLICCIISVIMWGEENKQGHLKN
jgi:hypothetical protein